MSYSLFAFIARSGTFSATQALSDCITVVPLAQGFEMVLNDGFLKESIEAEPEFAQMQPRLFELSQAHAELAQAQENVGEWFPIRLTDALVAFGLSFSSQQPIAYIEAEFWGGTGEQYAVLWHEGKVVALPTTNGLDSVYYKKYGFMFLKDAPINSVLRILGVQIEKIDEFASLGLDQERNLTDWYNRFNQSPNKAYCKDDNKG